jgi:dimethylargininase
MFTKAIVRPPSPNFAEGLTESGLGAPDYQLALRQHAAYCAALEECGLKLLRLPADARFPDSTFVEDTAVITPRCAVVTRPGAASRAGETEAIREALEQFFPSLQRIETPGTVDGGDICEAGNHFFIGLSERTNSDGAEQLARILKRHGYTAVTIDIRATPGLLHLKTGLSYLGENRLAVISGLTGHPAFEGFELHIAPKAEEYAANCVNINGTLLIPAGFPAFAAALNELGYKTIALEMSEFQKMDGGLSCLSLRF